MIAEVFFIRKYMEKAIQNRYKKLYIFLDAIKVVDILKKNVKVTWNVDIACEDIWHLSSYRKLIVLLHIAKSANVVAHNLAKVSISLSHELCWKRGFQVEL